MDMLLLLDYLSVWSICTETWNNVWHSWIRASWYNYESNQQDATI